VISDHLPRQDRGAIPEAPVGLLQRNHISIDLAQHCQDALGIPPPIEPDRLVDIVAGESQNHVRMGSMLSPARR
jgi:hypothetical protein